MTSPAFTIATTAAHGPNGTIFNITSPVGTISNGDCFKSAKTKRSYMVLHTFHAESDATPGVVDAVMVLPLTPGEPSENGAVLTRTFAQLT